MNRVMSINKKKFRKNLQPKFSVEVEFELFESLTLKKFIRTFNQFFFAHSRFAQMMLIFYRSKKCYKDFFFSFLIMKLNLM